MSVYFATCREANAVKIGSSVDPHGRIKEIQMGCPLLVTLEAVLPGNTEEEFALHRRFADDRIRGEWFAITTMIEAIIAANPAPERPAKAEIKRQKERRREIADRFELIDVKRQRQRYAQAMAEMRAEEEAAQ